MIVLKSKKIGIRGEQTQQLLEDVTKSDYVRFENVYENGILIVNNGTEEE